MTTFGYALAKGLKEPVSPFREAYFFGAPLNSVNADGWNAAPHTVDRVDTYDLSTITIDHEVCVAVLGAFNADVGTYSITIKYTRKRDNKLLYEYNREWTAKQGGWFYAYAYVGWTANEISENGTYRVDITVTGPAAFSDGRDFEVLGIPAAEPPPPPSGKPFDGFVGFFTDMASYMRSIADTIYDWIWPFYLVAIFFYTLEASLKSIASGFAVVGAWVDWLEGRIALILDLDTITRAFRQWIDAAVGAWAWVTNAVQNITDTIGDWWLVAQTTVQGWIAAATEGLADLKVAWSTFWSVTLPTLVDFAWLTTWWTSRLTDIGNLIDSAFTLRSGLWEGWQEARTNVSNFITTPLDWLWERFTDWFLGREA